MGKLSRLKKLVGANEMYSTDAEKRERRGVVRRRARRKEGAGEAGESRKGEELEAMCVLMLCSFLK